MPFSFQKLKIPDVILITPKVFEDERGFFMETFKKEDFEKVGIVTEFIQDNFSRSKYGVLRGLHFQRKPFEQAKLVRCERGVIFDVAVDLRKDSKTFKRHVAVILSEFNKKILFIPRGFAHGFVALSEVVEVSYKVDNKYAPDYECGVIWNDKELNIEWPIEEPILSEKDKKWPTLSEIMEKGLI